MGVDVTRGERESGSKLALNSKLGLLRIGIPKVRLVDENHLKWGQWAAIGHIEPKLRQPTWARPWPDTRIVSRCRRRAGDRSLGK